MNYFIPTEKARAAFLKEYLSTYPKNEVSVLGRSILARDIDCYRLGVGDRHIIYVGTHHAMEYITAVLLYDFISFAAKCGVRGGTFCDVDLEFLQQRFTFWIIPCLNPDGVEMHFFGSGDNPLTARMLRMNGGGSDFSHWQANARGVDLNHNYDAGFYEYKKEFEIPMGITAGKTRYSGEHPESEPEVRTLLRLIRTVSPSLIVSFHTQGGEVYAQPKNKSVASLAARAAALMGYKVGTPVSFAAYGGLADYSGGVLGIPSLTVELGRGENPLPPSQFPSLAESVRKLCVLLPTYL